MLNTEDETPEKSKSAVRESPPRIGLSRWMKGGLVSVLMLYCWSASSLLLPGMYSPRDLAIQVLRATQGAGNTLYYKVSEERLDRAARTVMDSAVIADNQEEKLDRAEGLLQTGGLVPAMLDTSGAEEEKQTSTSPVVGGRIVNIALIGVDSRMGVAPARADAIQVISINPDSGIVEIMAVPRGTIVGPTYDSTKRNIISYERRRGMTAFLATLSTLCRRGPINYYVEVGFSQVMGILELLGYKDPAITLRFLRSRKTFRTGDIQRSFNQSTFLRDNMMTKFGMFRGASGEAAVAAGLRFVSTNISRDFCIGIVHALNKWRFPHHRSDAVRVRILPRYRQHLLEVHADEAQLQKTARISDRIVGDSLRRDPHVVERLRTLIRYARKDTAQPRKVVERLRVPVSQHIWLQVQEPALRKSLREDMLSLQWQALMKLGRREEAESLQSLREAEDVLLHPQGR